MQGGLGRPGERESWTHGLENDVRVPYQQYVVILRVSVLMLGITYLTFLFVWLIASGFYYYRPPYVEFWGALWLAIRHTGWIIVRTMFIPPVLLTIPAWIFGVMLVWKRVRPNIIAPGWPAASGPGDPITSAQTFDEARRDMYDDEEEEEPAPTQRTLVVRLEQETPYGTRVQMIELPDVPELGQFARAVSNRQSFSEGVAARFHISRKPFEMMRDQFLDRGWAVWKNPKHKRQGVNLLAAGRRAMGRIAGHPPTEGEAVREGQIQSPAHARTNARTETGEG